MTAKKKAKAPAGMKKKVIQAEKEKRTDSFYDTMRRFSRGPQIVTPKDAAQIVAACGLRSNWRCADLGGGSGFLALFLANLVPRGSVVTYEKRKDFAKIIAQNIRRSGLRNVALKQRTASQLSERGLDMVTVDMKGAERVVAKAASALKPGGFLCVYSPHIEQQKAVVTRLAKAKLRHIKTFETIQRSWQVSEWTHPVPSQVVHTGFVTIARKE